MSLLGGTTATKPTQVVAPEPPTRAKAASRISTMVFAKRSQPTGRLSTILAPRGTIVDQIRSLLGG